MENQNKKDPAEIVDELLSSLQNKTAVPEEESQVTLPDLGPDELAIAQAGLIHPNDMELERIVQETIAENQEDTQKNPPEADPDATRQFTVPPESVPAPVQQEPVQSPAQPEPEDTPIQPEPVYEDLEPEIEEEIEENVVKETKKDKSRNKTKIGSALRDIPHVIATVIWLVLIVFVGSSLGKTAWLCAKDVLALGKESMSVSITVNENDDISDVAQKLKDAGLIEYPKLFEMFTKFTGKAEHILRGTIHFNEELKTSPDAEALIYDYNALANALSYRKGSRVTVDVMIPEGYNCAQIFALLEEKGVCSAAALEKYAAEGELGDYWFLTGVQRGHKYCLEGFLFPDTYEFYMGDEPGRVIQKLLNGFDYRFTDRMKDKFMALNSKLGLNLTLRDVVIMASIVEKEKASDGEGYSIASVFYNRLKSSGTYPFLQSDATIKYDVEYRSKGELVTDAQINASPYNTYTTKGLPVGPIANPGLSSLDAALDPEDTGYYFFIYDKSIGEHRFSKTLSEHNAWAKKLGFA